MQIDSKRDYKPQNHRQVMDDGIQDCISGVGSVSFALHMDCFALPAKEP